MRRFRLQSVHPGHSTAEIREHTGFDYDVTEPVPSTAEPSAEQLGLLRGLVAREIAPDYPEFARRVWGVSGSP